MTTSLFIVTIIWSLELLPRNLAFAWTRYSSRDILRRSYIHNINRRSFISMASVKDSSENLWNEWMQHDHTSYHNFTPDNAREIRQALLEWYRENRRKLPWRGDPLSQCKGSTAGINNAPKQHQQANITTFFAVKKVKPEPKSEASIIDDISIPVSAYGVWVSEIMLQQTRVEAVIPYWIKWMKSFPTVDDLAAATEDQVNAHWAGLGFYRRARLLHKGAKHVCFQLDGKIPETVDELLELPGVGRYTASAIASIAFDQPVAVVDGNVCRVLSRLTGIANHIKAPALKDKLGWGLANQLLEKDEKHAGEINQALMELGATYCAPNGTGIDPRDPLRHYYKSRKLGKAFLHYDQESSIGTGCELCDPNGILAVKEKFTNNISSSMSLEEAAKVGHATFPLNPPKTKKREEDLAVFCCSCTNQQGETFHLLQKRAPKGLLAGQWEFPNVCIQTRTSKSKPPPKSKVQKTLKQYLQEEFVEDDEWITQLDRTPITSTSGAPLEHIFSHVKHIMWIESSTCANMDMDRLEFTTQTGQREVRWMQEQDMKQVGITSGVKKILKAASTASKKKIATKRKRKR